MWISTLLFIITKCLSSTHWLRCAVHVYTYSIQLVILFVLGCMKRRVNVCPGCCNGRPGLVV